MQTEAVNYHEVAHIRPMQTRTGGPVRRESPFVEYGDGELAAFVEDGQVYVYWRGARPPTWLDVSTLVLAKEEGAQAPLS